MRPADARFSSAFGTPRAELLRYKRKNEVPEVSTMVSTLMADGTTDKTALRSEDWHTDDSYMAVPAKATLLQQGGNAKPRRPQLVLQVHSSWIIRLLFRHPMEVQRSAEEYLARIRDAGFTLPQEGAR